MTIETLEKVETPEIEVTDELRKEVFDKIVVARVGLLLRHPFFGNMATRLVIKEATDIVTKRIVFPNPLLELIDSPYL